MNATTHKCDAYKCDECEELFLPDDADAGALYECGDCGTRYTRENSANDNHQCPDCMKFGAKVSDYGCPECGSGELEPLYLTIEAATPKPAPEPIPDPVAASRPRIPMTYEIEADLGDLAYKRALVQTEVSVYFIDIQKSLLSEGRDIKSMSPAEIGGEACLMVGESHRWDTEHTEFVGIEEGDD